MNQYVHQCSVCNHISEGVDNPNEDPCLSCESNPKDGIMLWIEPLEVELNEYLPLRYNEEIDAFIVTNTNEQFIVISRVSKGKITKGFVYPFLEDKDGHVWKIIDINVVGFVAKAIRLQIEDEQSTKRYILVSSNIERYDDALTDCLCYADNLIKRKNPIRVSHTSFTKLVQWMPCNRERAQAAWLFYRMSYRYAIKNS